MTHITYQDIRDILKMRIDFRFEEKHAREYACLDILNEQLAKSGMPNVGDFFVSLRDAYDKGYKARMAEEKEG
jgi:hypothetical protein